MKVKNYLLTRLSSRFNQGYTLIELLVVIMIIGILSGIALPSFSALLNKSKSVEGLNNVRNLAQSQRNYYIEAGFFTDSPQQLGSTLPKETENYAHEILVDNNSLNGAVHIALSKKIGVKSYIDVVYIKNGEPWICAPVEVNLMYPLNSPSNLGVVVDVFSNPANYCR